MSDEGSSSLSSLGLVLPAKPVPLASGLRRATLVAAAVHKSATDAAFVDLRIQQKGKAQQQTHESPDFERHIDTLRCWLMFGCGVHCNDRRRYCRPK